MFDFSRDSSEQPTGWKEREKKTVSLMNLSPVAFGVRGSVIPHARNIKVSGQEVERKCLSLLIKKEAPIAVAPPI